MSTYNINNAYIKEKYVVGAKLECEGPIGQFLDHAFYPNEGSFESSELKMVNICLNNVPIAKCDLLIAGDLSNQIAISTYSAKNINKPMLGIYAACATINEGIGLAAIILDNPQINNILVYTSSYNQTAERQFRNPIEYGGERSGSQTFTSTIAASCIVTKSKSKVKINKVTFGKIYDIDFKNAMDFGRCMVPAAIETILEHLSNTSTVPSDYDLILTGDLSFYGAPIVKKELERRFGKIDNYKDSGLIIYDITKQKVFAGGSGPGTIAAVLLSYVYSKIEDGTYKRVLVCATGALMNPIMSNQKRSIPSICHIIELGGEL